MKDSSSVPRNAAARAFLALALAASFLLCGCRGLASFTRDVEPLCVKRVAMTQSGQILDLKEGERLALHLPDRRPEYRWRIIDPPAERILKPLRQRGRETIAAGPAVIVYFDAVAPGITAFALELFDSEAGESTGQRFEMTVRVTY